MTPAVAAPPATLIQAGRCPPLPGDVDLRAVADELIRDLIRRDPALWARVQEDPVLRRDFGFDDTDMTV